ncbi:MAG: hypothetical protein IT307_03175 [Chloroflexi bacterium]|nr:hypothetical protein [Chloroflexota bacterium]
MSSLPPANRPASEGFLAVGVMLAVVLMFVGIWLVLFMATFVGYLTIPVILLFVFLLLWAGFDKIQRRSRRTPAAREPEPDAS